jgi:hypothetical protein
VRRAAAQAVAGVKGLVGISAESQGLRSEVSRAVEAAGAGQKIKASIALGTPEARALFLETRRAARAAEAGASIDVPVSAETRGLRGQVSRAVSAAGAGQNVKVGVKVDFKDIVAAGGGVTAGTLALKGLVVPAAAIHGLGAATGGVTALAGAAVAAAAPLGKLAGLLPALGVGAIALGAGFGVAKLATAGLSDAMKAAAKADEDVAEKQRELTDARAKFGAGSKEATAAQKALTEALEKQAQAFDGVSPAAARFGQTLRSLQPQVKALQATAAGSLFPGVERGLVAVLPLFREFGPVVDSLAGVLGNLTDSAGQLLGSPMFQSSFRQLGGASVDVLHRLGVSALTLLPPLSQLLVAAIPLATRLADLGISGARAWAGFIDGKAKTGALAESFAEAERTLRLFGSILGNVTGAVGGLFSAALPTGREYIGLLDQASEKLRNLVRSDAGQSGLARFFAESKPIVLEFMGLVNDAVKGLGGIGARLAPELRPIIVQLRAELLPALLDIVNSIDGDFLSSLVTLATQVTNFAGAFMVATPTLKVFLGIIGDLAEAVTFLFSELGPLSFVIAQVATALSVAGVAAAGLKLARLVSEFAGARAGASLLAGSLGTAGVAGAATTAASSAAVAAGAFGKMRAGLAGAALAAGPYVAAFLVMRNVADRIAPSIDKAVAAIQRAGGSLQSFDKEARKLTDPSFFESFGTNLKRNLSPELFSSVFRPLDAEAKKAATAVNDTFRKLAETTPDLAFKVVDAFKAAGRPTEDLIAILSKLGLYQDYLSSSTALLTTKTETWAGATQLAGDKVEGLRTKLDGLLNPTRAQEAALINVRESVDNLSKSLTLNGTSLDVNSEKGRANSRAIGDVVGKIEEHISALIANGATQDEVRSNFDRHIEDFRRVLRQMGFNQQEIDALIAKYGLIPETVETAVELTGAEKARRDAEALVADLVREFGIAQEAAEITVRVFGAERARESVAAIKADTGDITKSFDSARPSDYEEGFDGRSAGGPVRKGIRYLVGEIRPELFDPDGAGRPWVVGARGPGFFVPPVSGRIIPHLPAVAAAGRSAAPALRSSLAGHTAALTSQLSSLAGTIGGGYSPAASAVEPGWNRSPSPATTGAGSSAPVGPPIDYDKLADAIERRRKPAEAVFMLNGREFARATAGDVATALDEHRKKRL